MCVLVAQTMASELLRGGGGRRDYPSPPTFLFFIKDCTFVVTGPSFVRRNARVSRVCSGRRRVLVFFCRPSVLGARQSTAGSPVSLRPEPRLPPPGAADRIVGV